MQARSRDASKCSAYDPRVRPWYIAAATGPKEVVVLADTSESTGASVVSPCPIHFGEQFRGAGRIRVLVRGLSGVGRAVARHGWIKLRTPSRQW